MIDWRTMIVELRTRGQRFSSMSDSTGVSKSTLVTLGAGKGQPLYSNGERLIQFWMKHTGKDRAELPTHKVGTPPAHQA